MIDRKDEHSASPHPLARWLEAFRVAVTSEALLILVFTSICIGLFYGKAFVSTGAGIFFGVALLNRVLRRDAFHALRKYPALIAFVGIWLVYLVSGLHSDDTQRWLKLVWQNALYVMIPIGFYAYRTVHPRTWVQLLVLFLLVTTLSALSVMIDYILHFETYNQLYRIGKSIPTPVIHVRYAYFIALGSCLAFAMWYVHRGIPGTLVFRRLLLIAAGFLTVFTHILAVRTGIVALYGGLIVMLGFITIRDGHWKIGAITGISVFLLLIIAYNAFPSVKNKIDYVVFDLKVMREQGALSEYSDNLRITSIRHGLDLVREYPVTGTGIGDLITETDRMYTERTPEFPIERRFPPISQYIFVLTAFGIAGALVYFAFLLYPLFATRFSYVLLAVYAATLFSAIGETTIELQLGKTVFVCLACIAILHANAAFKPQST
jgi:O-antigen ligase